MDIKHFDSLAKSLSPVLAELAHALGTGASRRGMLAGLVGVLLAGMPNVFGGDAAARKRRKKRNKRRTSRKPAPTCSDGIQNGSETGVDCGGDCPRCADGQGCATRNDCVSARCDGGTCLSCTSNISCGTDAGGNLCLCGEIDELAQKACLHAEPQGPWVADCAECPPGTICDASNPGVFDCLQLCGTVDE